jgi:hypothetical protein
MHIPYQLWLLVPTPTRYTGAKRILILKVSWKFRKLFRNESWVGSWYHVTSTGVILMHHRFITSFERSIIKILCALWNICMLTAKTIGGQTMTHLTHETLLNYGELEKHVMKKYGKCEVSSQRNTKKRIQLKQFWKL